MPCPHSRDIRIAAPAMLMLRGHRTFRLGATSNCDGMQSGANCVGESVVAALNSAKQSFGTQQV